MGGYTSPIQNKGILGVDVFLQIIEQLTRLVDINFGV